MFDRKIELIIIVTIFAVIFTTLVYISPVRYAQLWLNLEVIIIPTLYLVGYEYIIQKQKLENEYNLSLLSESITKLEKEKQMLILKLRNVRLK